MKNKINRLFGLTFLLMMIMTNHLFAQSGQPKAADPTLEMARHKIDSLDKKLGNGFEGFQAFGIGVQIIQINPVVQTVIARLEHFGI